MIILMYVMAVLYILAGINHFVQPKFYMKIMPPYIPAHKLMVDLSGVAEVLLGIGLFFPQTRSWAAIGLIALLIAVLPANIYMLTERLANRRFRKIPVAFLWFRLPLQALLIYWAYLYI
ncbi:MAG TPA: DoxX family protein [Microscillaceae bacterium]|nr:DoxX family protein [Microscillaceae bacterium]